MPPHANSGAVIERNVKSHAERGKFEMHRVECIAVMIQ